VLVEVQLLVLVLVLEVWEAQGRWRPGDLTQARGIACVQS
jgi:hypothetical protein